MIEVTQEGSGSIFRVKFTRECELLIIGTAHVSKQSVNEVRESIINYSTRPHQLHKIFLELDEKRLKALEDMSFKDINIREVLRSGQGYFFTAYLLLSLFQRKIAEEVGTEPGGEFKAALRLARERNISLELIDRSADITLKRCWRKMSVWQQLKLLLGGWSLPLASPSVSEDQKEQLSTAELIETLKESDKMTQMIADLERPFPTIKRVLLDERDIYMAKKIELTLEQVINRRPETNFLGLVVVGAAHVAGMIDYWKKRSLFIKAIHEKPRATLRSSSTLAAAPETTVSSDDLSNDKESSNEESLKDLEVVPRPGWFWKNVKRIIPGVIIGLFAWGFYRADWNVVKDAFLVWVLANGLLSAIGAVIARAHPLTVVVAIVAAPFTSLNPTIGAGLVAAWFEAYIRPPSMHDLETVQLKLSPFKLWWKNQLTRILLVFIFVSFGSALGTWVALPYLLGIFS
ncbi:hypothetical protein COTS27_01262 [Spirochaetota bacterium]|nr:hypothetical protein COTS27_01262 [Spirochaetota bacterium]